ncbi:MAG: OmpH family outer membrane protein [Bacteroidales bacterium]|nr:OmpH family outer membrane protein [Bacteroidales bacterium]MCF8338621.1 OmpH family outer membrane protein [Bacteroidales bacterium]
MKHLSKLVLFFIAVILTAGSLNAQTNAKLGYVNSSEILQNMPGRDTLEQKLKDYRNDLKDQINSMMVEYRDKLKKFESKKESMSDLIRQSKQQELRELEQRIQSFRQTADKDIQNKQQELFNPLIERVKNAIEKVSEEEGYTYVFDVSMGTLLYYEKGDSIQPLVEKELGIR